MNDFAASPGQVSDLSSSGLSNNFSNLPSNNVDSAFNSDRVQPRQVASGVTRGTQFVGYGSVKIDGANERISVGENNEANLILGDQSDSNSNFGFSVSDGSHPRFLGGKFPDGNIKIKLSQVGYDVSTATDDQLIWSSDFNMFKIVRTGAASITPPSSWTSMSTISVPIPHAQLTTPAVSVYVTNPNLSFLGYTSPGLANLPSSIFLNTSGSLLYSASKVDETNLYIELTNVTGLTTGWEVYTWTYKYYIMKETAAAS